jgi:hypothetical protein
MFKNIQPDELRDQPQTVAPALISSDISAPISETNPRDWTYIAEGGSTIVFSYDGPRNLHFDGTVIRLRKSPVLPPSSLSPPDPDEKTSEGAEDPTVDFQEHVISRLVSPEFLPHLEHVRVERSWLERMVGFHDDQRPAKRRTQDGIDLKRTRAVLATDLIGSKGWAVEIKVLSDFSAFLTSFRSNHGYAYSQSGVLNRMLLFSHRPLAPSSRACVGSA